MLLKNQSLPKGQKFQCFALLFATIGLLRFPQETSAAVTQGLALCGQIIIPALFPFFILSALVIDLGLSHPIGRSLERLMSPLFRLNGNCATALVLGFVGGYPVGAKTALSLYESGQCSQTEAKRMLAFCNNAGPAFLIGVVGTGLFGSGRMAFLFYLSHILACLTVGILFRFYKPHHRPSPSTPIPLHTKSFLPAFLSAVSGSIQSTLSICGFILCFSVVISLLKTTGLLSFLGNALALLPCFTPDLATSFLIGLVELSSGVTSVPSHFPLSTQVALLSFFLGWAGLSVHCQVLALGEGAGLSMKTYFVGNFAQGIFSAVYSLLLLPLLAPTIPLLADNQEVMASASFSHHLFLSTTVVWIVFLLFAFSWLPPKKG